jgi:hypothetical protein
MAMTDRSATALCNPRTSWFWKLKTTASGSQQALSFAQRARQFTQSRQVMRNCCHAMAIHSRHSLISETQLQPTSISKANL